MKCPYGMQPWNHFVKTAHTTKPKKISVNYISFNLLKTKHNSDLAFILINELCS